MRITDFPELVLPLGADLVVGVDVANDITKRIKLENLPVSIPTSLALATKQDLLVSGTSIKTLNSVSLLGSGNIVLTANANGVAGAVQFSDGSAFNSDASNLFWDNTNKRLGVGTNLTTIANPALDQVTQRLYLNASTGQYAHYIGSTVNLVTGDTSLALFGLGVTSGGYSGGIRLFTSNISVTPVLAMIVDRNQNVGIGLTNSTNLTASARLHIIGSGTTSATSSLLVQNNLGTTLLTVLDNGFVGIGTSTVPVMLTLGGVGQKGQIALRRESDAGQIGLLSAENGGFILYGGASVLTMNNGYGNGIATTANGITSAMWGIKGSGSTSATTSLLVQNSSGTELLKVTDNGSTTLYGLGINSTAAVGSVSMNLGAGFSISTPTSFQVRSGITDSAVFFVNGNNATPFSYFTGNTAIGSTTDLNARLGVKGSGATSTTTALLVQNSAGTAALTVRDDLAVIMNGLTITTLSASSNVNIQNTIIADSGQIYRNGNLALQSVSGVGNNNSVLINTTPNNTTVSTCAILGVVSTTKGFLPPVMTTTQRDAIASPLAGLIVFNSTLGTLDIYDGTGWDRFGSQTLIRGSGSTSATTTLLIQNSAGNRILQSYDDRTTHINTLIINGENTYGNGGFSMSSGGAGLGYIAQTTYGGSYNSALNIGIGAFSFTRNAGNLTGGHDFFVLVENTFANASAPYTQNQSWSDLQLKYTINNTLTSTGVATGLLLNATETALNGMTHRLMDLQVGGASRFTVLPNGNVGIGTQTPNAALEITRTGSGANIKLYNIGASYNDIISGANFRIVNTTSGGIPATDGFWQNTTNQVGINTNAQAATLHVKGAGATSATTTFLVQNSSSTQALKIADDGGFQIGSIGGAGTGLSIRTDSGGGGINSGINTNFNNGATWNDDTNVCALKIAYNNGIRIANTTRYPLTLGSDTKAVASAQLEMISTTQGFLMPRMTTTQINAIASPATGLEVFNTTLNCTCFYNGTSWRQVTHTAM